MSEQTVSNSVTSDCLTEPSLSLDAFQKAVEQVEKQEAVREPVVCYTKFLDDAIYHGDLVDQWFERVENNFDSKKCKGFIIPERYRGVLESRVRALKV